MNLPVTRIITRIISASLLAVAVSLAATGTAAAHVVVRPAEVETAAFQTFTVSAPNEKPVAYTAIRVDIPAGLKHVTPTVKQGWQATVVKEGEGEAAVVKSITWNGSQVAAGFRDDFSFSAQVPATAADLQWKAYQTYADGVTVTWDRTEAQQPKKADGSPDFSVSGPFSATKVVAQTGADRAVLAAKNEAKDANKAADRALYVGAAGIVVGLTGVALATRRKNS
jgi:uncharacterized protein YcnI